jgi:uncharacterized alkaline shock family protein YloU
MNIFNRIVVIVGSICLVMGSSSLFLITIGVVDPQEWFLAPWHEVFIPFTQLDPSRGWSILGLCFGGLIVGVILLFVELRSHDTKVPTLTIEKDNLGNITASMTSIQDLANREAETIEGVRESLTQVQNSSRGIYLKCRLSVAPHTNASQLGQQVQERIKTAVEHYLGKPVLGINLQTQIAPLTKHTKGIQSRVH